MPSVSKSQQRLFQAADHGAQFPKAAHLRKSLTHQQLHDFSSGSEQGKPERMRTSGYAEQSHRGNAGRKPVMRHG